MTGGGWVSQADRERWQREAAGELASILAAHPGLPLLAWTVGPAGGSLAGRVTGQQEAGASARAAFTAWRQALGLGDVLEVPAVGGSGTWLRASALRGGVRITVTAACAAGQETAS